MGGNIFKGKSRRYVSGEYKVLEQEVILLLNNNCFTLNSNDNVNIIPTWKLKPSFGDCDLVVNSKYLKNNYIELIVKHFNLAVGEWSKNGNVFSFLYKEFQIDLIITNENILKCSIDYFKFSDLQNLSGRIFHKLGIKLGHDGSYIIVKENDNVLGDILLSKNISDVHKLIGLDHDEWLDGFDTMEDAYKWLVKTPYFNKEIYSLDNRNAAARIRDKKRENYRNFLVWVETQEGLPEFPYSEMTSRTGYNIREPYWSDLIVPAFPHVLEEYNAIINKHHEHKLFKDKFNGDIVHKITELKEKELGMFMSWCRKVIEKHDLTKLFIKHGEHTNSIMIRSMKFHYENNLEWLKIPIDLAISIARNEGLVR